MIEARSSSVPNVKGSALASRVKWVSLHFGEAGVHRLAASATAELRQVVETRVVMSHWYGFDQYIELNVLIDQLFGRGDLSLVHTLGRYGADANLTTIYRLFYRVGMVSWTIDRAWRLWGMHYDSGRLIVRRFPERQVELEIRDFATPHRVHCASVRGWAERSLQLCGASQGAVVDVSCRAAGQKRCALRLFW